MSALKSSQSTPGRDETQLVAAVRRGDDDAFGELYGRYGGSIVAYIASTVGDHARAEDIAQDVFISALRRIRVTERPIAFKPWIYEIARNACIDEFRRNRRSQEVPLRFGEEDDDGAQRLVSRVASPDDALESRQRLDDLRGAFRGLSESHHKILVMRELEGLSYTQIGERLGISRPVVESTLFRARRRLGSEYQEIASGRRCEQVRTVVELGAERSLSSLGIRERRRLNRHLSHCQPCRRYAHAAGVDVSSLGGAVIGKIAALLPIPGFLRLRRLWRGHKLTSASTHSSRAAQSLHAAAQWADSGSSGFGFDRVAGAVAALAVAGGGVFGALNIPGSKHAGPRHGQAIRAAAFSNSPSVVDQPQPLGIAAVAAGNRQFRFGPVVPHSRVGVSHSVRRGPVSSVGGRLSQRVGHSSYQAAAPQTTTYAPAAPASSSSSSSSASSASSGATQSRHPTSARSGSGMSQLSGSAGSTVSGAQNTTGSTVQQLSQVGSSTVSQVVGVGSQVINTAQGLVNQATGGSL